MFVSKILISGCGISWSAQERPTWVNVLKICGVNIDDQAGPAISNHSILNSMIDSVLHGNYSQAVCQLTATGKLDVELTEHRKKELVEKDKIRNFTHKELWPSSVSTEHSSKKLYYEYLYSPNMEQKDIVHKWMLLYKLCQEKNIKLHTLFGYKINWTQDKLRDSIKADHGYAIWDDYISGEYYKFHDHSSGERNTVPNKHFMIYLARKINSNFLKLDIDEKLQRFHE